MNFILHSNQVLVYSKDEFDYVTYKARTGLHLTYKKRVYTRDPARIKIQSSGNKVTIVPGRVYV